MSGDVTYIDHVLDSTSAIPSITIVADCTSIRGQSANDYAFIKAAKTLTKCSFETNSQLQIIQQYAFYQCSKLVSIDLSVCTKLTLIGSHSFYDCTSLATVIFPSSLKTIEEYAFYNTGIQTMRIPMNTTSIGSYCFAYCPKMNDFSFEEGSLISTLSDHALMYTKIASFYIPEFLKVFHGSLFEYCYSLKSFTIHNNNQNMAIPDQIVVTNKDKTQIVIYPPGRSEDYNVINGITILCPSSFTQSRLSQITLSSTIDKISSYCFSGSLVENIVIPSSCEIIENNAFYGCSKLESLIIPEGVTSIGNSAFQSCGNLKSIQLPSTLTSLGGGVFVDCPDNISIEFGDTSKLEFDKTNYWITDKEHTYITQCFGTQSSYTIPKTYTTLKSFSFRDLKTLHELHFESDSVLTMIELGAFMNCNNLETFDFPPLLSLISTYAFQDCTSLQSADLSQCSNLEEISISAFKSCQSLTLLKFPPTSGSLIVIKETAFEDCSLISTLDFGQSIQSIGQYCFHRCKLLSSLNIPSSCERIDDSAFYDCSNIKTCTFADDCKVENISSFLFYNCISLDTITFSSNIQAIGSYALYNTNITSFTLPQNVKTVGRYAFCNCKNLVTFKIPDGSELDKFEISVFNGCSKFSSVENSSPNFIVSNHALFDIKQTELIILPPACGVKYFAFPENVTTIRNSALEDVQTLEVVYISSSVTTIQEAAFKSCTHLQYFNLPKNVVNIGANAFEGCRNIQCGLSIENRNQEYVDNLIKNALLPNHALKTCIRICTENQEKLHCYRAFVFIALQFSTI